MECRRNVGAGERLPEPGGPGAGPKKAQPTAAILDSQSVKNTATSTARVGYDAGTHLKGRKGFFLVDTLGNLVASCVVAANCHDGATAAKGWDAWALGNELLDQVQTVFVDGGFGRRFRQYLARRGIQAQVPTGVLAHKGRFFIHAKRWVVERSIAWAGNNRRLAKDYERKTTHANAWLYLANIRRLARLT
jgi:transposase